jgi:hypothetical protein
MKRILVFCILLSLAAHTAFAGGQIEAENSAVSSAVSSPVSSVNSITAVGIGYKQTNYKLGYSDYYESTNDVSGRVEKIKIPAFDINMTSFITKKTDPFAAGFLFDMDLLILSSPNYTREDDGILVSEQDMGLLGYNSGFGLQMILGPGFSAELADGLSLQMGLGAHFNMGLISSSDYTYDSILALGLGVGNITRLNWQFNDKTGLMFGFDIAYDFLSYTDGLDGTSDVYGNGSAFSFSPLILVSFSNFGGSANTSSKAKSSSEGRESESGSRTKSPDSTDSEDSGSDPYDDKKDNPMPERSKESDADPYD